MPRPASVGDLTPHGQAAVGPLTSGERQEMAAKASSSCGQPARVTNVDVSAPGPATAYGTRLCKG